MGRGAGTKSGSRGRGAAHRHAVVAALTVHGRHGRYEAQTIDISRTGALVWITDERFAAEGEYENIVAYSERVAEELGAGVTLSFVDGAIRRQAEIARVARVGPDDAGPICIACRFASRLTEEEAHRIGGPPPIPKRSTGGAPDHERRATPRLESVLVVDVQGDYGTYRGQALNVSADGVLIAITDPRFGPRVVPNQVMVYTKRMIVQFARGMQVHFREADLRVRCDVVRVDERRIGSELFFVIGCKFQSPLTREETERFRLPARQTRPASSPPNPEPEPAAPAPARPAPEAPAVRKPAAAPASLPVFEPGELTLDGLLKQALQCGATDLHVKAGQPPRMRVAGSLVDLGEVALGEGQTRAMGQALLSPAQREAFHRDGDLELVKTLPEVGRFRISVLRQRGCTSLVARCIPAGVPSLRELGLSAYTARLAERTRGLVLVTGPTGAGKSTTLAAMVDHVNEGRACHILTLEDPVEYLHADKRAHVTQREIGRDAPDFASALRHALRHDPDVILVGELRDAETAALALTAAETGHLVLATLHTASAAHAADRIVDLFPPAYHHQARAQLADHLQGVLAQVLVPRRDGEGVAIAQEVLVVNDAVRALIRERKTAQILNAMQTGGRDGMQTLEAALKELVRREVITPEIAQAHANRPQLVR